MRFGPELGNTLYCWNRTTPTVRRPALAAALALACIAALAAAPLPVSAHINDIRADAQVSADGTVLVETAYVADDAWLAVYAGDDGERGELLGTRRMEGAGFRTDFAVTIDEESWADWSAGEARPVHVALHSDDGSGGFDREEDGLLTSFGREATDRLMLERGEPAYVGTRAFSPQEVDDPSVTVRTVRLPTDGHLVARNVTDPGGENEAAGEPVGATALEAGSHDSVTIRLNESYYEDLGSRPRIAFTLYADDGNGAFGAGDEPIRAGEDGVTTVVYLNRTDGSSTATATDSGGSVVTTATVTDDGDDGSLVTTATPSVTPTDSPATTDGAADMDSGATDDATGQSTDTDGQPGFGAVAALLAAVVLAVGAARRRT